MVAPILSAMARCADGGIIRSWVVTRYQLGLARQAGSVMAPAGASTPHGTCESAMNAAWPAGRSAANEAWNLSRSRKQEAVPGRQDRRLRPAGRESADERADRLVLVRCERADVDQGRDV